MSSTTEPRETCSSCHADRPLVDLLIVIDRARPERRRYVCRPSIPERMGGPHCFRRVGPSSLYAIEPADPQTGRAGA